MKRYFENMELMIRQVEAANKGNPCTAKRLIEEINKVEIEIHGGKYEELNDTLKEILKRVD